MPEQTPPPDINPVNLESAPLVLADQSFTDAYALETVNRTFFSYENFRQQNHDGRWNGHDALYFGWLPPKVWEGTTTPRASLGMQSISFGQIEAAVPAISQALFSDEDWFQVSPEPGSTPEESRGIQGHLMYNLEHGESDKSVEIDIEYAIRQVLLNGNGGVSVEWDSGMGRPIAEWVDLRDIYVDPGCPTPFIDDARSVIRLKRMTIDEVVALGADKRMKIPPRPVLVYLANNASMTYGDRTKTVSEAFRGVNYVPGQSDYNPLPADRKIEVMIYYSKSRIIWVFGRRWVAFNEKNPYGFYPFCFAPCFPVAGRFYAQSFCDVLEGMQRYVEALINGHLDELSLNLHPPRVRKRGGLLTPSQQRWRPGQIQEAENPKDDVVVQWPQPMLTDVMGDVSFLEANAEKLTGVNSTGMGVPRPGNVNRTATGVQSQLQGGASRLWTIVKHMEDYLIVPMLYKMYKLTQYHTLPGKLLPALGPSDQQIQVGSDAFHKPCRFRMLASSKMMTREKLAQVFPFLMQYLMNGAFLAELKSVGKTVDFEEIIQLLQDATGTGSLYHLVRPMTQQEQQASQQPPPQVAMQQQLAQMDAQTRTQIMQMKIQGDLQKTQMQKQDPAAAQQEQQQEQQKAMMDMAMQKAKMEMDAQNAKQKLAMEAQKHHMTMQHEAQKSQQQMMLDAVMGQHQIQQSRDQHAMSMQMQAQQAQQQQQMAGQQHEQSLSQSRETGEQKVQQQQVMGQHKIGMEKERMKLDHQRGMADVKNKVTIARETAKAKSSAQPKKPAAKK